MPLHALHLFPPFLRRSFLAVSLDRHGGVSPEPWDSLNLGATCGDRRANVVANRERVRKALGLAALVCGQQVHGDRVAVIRETPGDDVCVGDCDGLVTAVPGVGLLILQADCQAVVLADPVRRVIGACHCGWRGTVAGIITATVTAMAREFGTVADDLLAAVSPSLGPCCAEFRDYQELLPQRLHRYLVAGKNDQQGTRTPHVDFWAASGDELAGLGIKRQNIHLARVCSHCDGRFFSHRRANPTGRNGTVAAILP